MEQKIQNPKKSDFPQFVFARKVMDEAEPKFKQATREEIEEHHTEEFYAGVL